MTILAMFLGSSHPAAAQPLRVEPGSRAGVPVTFQRLEWRVDPVRQYDNPFDPDQIAIEAVFSGPESRQLVLPAFFDGPDRGFIVRFCAPSPGKWSMTVTAKDRLDTRTCEPIKFDVAASKSRGFIRRALQSPRYFQFDSGDPYFIIGINLAWAGKEGIVNYERDLESLGNAGANFARVWMADPKMESSKLGLGRYDLESCAYYDRVLEIAEKNGVSVMLTFNNYRDLRDKDEWGVGGWPTLVYNAANGGPATRPSDFGTNADCIKAYRNRLRYIVARWSSFTNIAFWEFFNEQNFSLANIPPAWTLDNARYLKAIDPYKHLVTTSFGPDEPREVWESGDIDLVQAHLYPGDSAHDDSASVIDAAAVQSEFGKPTLVAELGIHHLGSDIKYDPKGTGTNLHNTVWAGMMSGAAGGACNWWWDSYVRELNLWHVYRGASKFAAHINWSKRKFAPLEVPPVLAGQSDSSPPTFTDIVIRSAGVWSRHHGQPIEILPSGQAPRSLPHYIFGPDKPELRTPTILKVDLPRDTKMKIRVARVSDYGMLRVFVDAKATVDFPFSALPGAPDQEKTEQHDPKIYQATINKDYTVDLPAGKHSIELRQMAGDWISIASITLTGARSSRYAPVDVIALSDESSGETLAWLRDQQSNWYNDLQGMPTRKIDGAAMSLPVSAGRAGEFRVQWFDTRSGDLIRADEHIPVRNGALQLSIPVIDRDIALRATRSDGQADAGE